MADPAQQLAHSESSDRAPPQPKQGDRKARRKTDGTRCAKRVRDTVSHKRGAHGQHGRSMTFSSQSRVLITRL